MKTPICVYSYPAGIERTAEMSPTGECLCSPVGAFFGMRGGVWYHCSKHREYLVNVVTEHCDSREFPLTEATVEEALVFQVMFA